MSDIGVCIDKYGKVEGARFIRWCIKNKESARTLFCTTAPIDEDVLEAIIKDMENAGLYEAAFILQMSTHNRSKVMDIILSSSVDDIDALDDDYLAAGINEYLWKMNARPETGLREFEAFWQEYISTYRKARDYKYQTFTSWSEQEWYEWSYICNTQNPDPQIIEALYEKINALIINDPSFIIVRALIQERFYEIDDCSWKIKESIKACKEIEQKYGDKNRRAEEILKSGYSPAGVSIPSAKGEE
ncbi:hypothetical protein QMP26_41665 (plasmid) [Enterocloster clostridioformis]